MVNQKIKKSESTLAGITFSIIIGLGIFFGMFLWIQSNSTESGVSLNDPSYNESYVRLLDKQDALSDTVNDVTSGAKNLTEAGSDFGIAWNGLKGLVSIFKAPLQLIDIGKETFELMTAPLAGIIPQWILNLIVLGLVAFIVYVIVSIFKGDPNVIR